MKRKWSLVLLAVLVLWAGVSYYFYTQHKYVVQEYDFNKTVKVGETQVIFRQTCFTNYSQKARPADEQYNMPWYYKAISHLPVKMQFPLIKVFAFYRSPYQVNPDGTLKVKGIIISPEPFEENVGPLDKSVDIELYYGEDRFTLTGRRLAWEGNTNVYWFSFSVDNVPDAVDQVTAVVTDKETGEKKSLLIKPDWDTKVYHNSWRPEFPFSPEETIRQFIMILSDKGVEQNKLQPFVLSSVVSSFPWENLQHSYWQRGYKSEIAYLGNYKGYQDVYSYKLLFLDGTEKIVATDKIVASQKIYLVEQKDGWKIIDVSTVRSGNPVMIDQIETARQFVKSKGYSIMMNSGANFDLRLPVSFDGMVNDVKMGEFLKTRNELSKQNGFDFSSCLGKEVTFITYGVKNEKNIEANVDLILYGNRIVGFWVDDYEEPSDFSVIVNAYQ